MSNSSYNQHGASLIEVLIALLIFTVGLLGLAAMQLSSLQSTADSGQRSQAAWLMHDLAERMRANPDGALVNYQAAPNCAALPNPICADYFSPATNAKVNAANCSTEQMAAFDRWEAQCSYAAIANFNPNGSSRFNSRDFLIAPDDARTPITLVNNTLSVNWFSKTESNKPPLPAQDDEEGEEDEEPQPVASASVQSAAVEIVR